ncbi:MAG: glycosyltransferase involved in cell wall biosynthesis [Candidatus Azotimanducaceae bacterium]|jgi:glycosyltransferase involved in cell wall biosynthesis
MMKRIGAKISLNIAYLMGALISILLKPLQKPAQHHGRVMVCVTIDNPNWFRAHIEPLAYSGHGEILIICDEPLEPIPNLVYACPPIWMQRVFSRAGAKFLTTLRLGIKQPCDLIMGYHIFPCALIALVCARLLRTRAAYQVTSGITEIEGGGYGAENRILRALDRPSRSVETSASLLAKQFDVMIVRGSSVRQYIQSLGYQGSLEILTGCVRIGQKHQTHRDIDVIFVGRLVEIKQLDTLLRAIAVLVKSHPAINVSVVGDGPDREQLKHRTTELGIDAQVNFLGQRDDVYELLQRAKTFALTSRSESVSIAMLEAMSRGAVPVVTRVGDLSDFVQDNQTGFTIDVGDHDALAQHLSMLLEEPDRRNDMAANAVELVSQNCSMEAIAAFWGGKLRALDEANNH